MLSTCLLDVRVWHGIAYLHPWLDSPLSCTTDDDGGDFDVTTVKKQDLDESRALKEIRLQRRNLQEQRLKDLVNAARSTARLTHQLLNWEDMISLVYTCLSMMMNMSRTGCYWPS